MPSKSWKLTRRTLLHGVGVSLGLPYLECMADDTTSGAEKPHPNRFCSIYFPYGIVNLAEGDENAEWGWWPHGDGKSFRFNRTLKPLEPFRDNLTFFQGFQHPRAEKGGGHFSADIFLTGADWRALHNSVSADQVAAAHLGDDVRFPSLVLSSEGGVGNPRMSHTLSYNAQGRPIPGIAEPREVYATLFGANTPSARQQLARKQKGLDLLLEDARSIERSLGREDRQKMEELLASLRKLEQDVARSQNWLDVAKAKVCPEELVLDAEASGEDPQAYLRVMYDLIYHAFRTDSTRVSTFQTCSMRSNGSIPTNWPRLTGFRYNAHSLAHGAKNNSQDKSRWDSWMLEQFAYFLKRLQETPEGDASLLDRTLVLYGSTNSWTHQNRNYPLVFAGGRKMGFEHGQYIKNNRNRPMSDILLTMLQGMGVPASSFADSTGELSEMKG